MLGHPMIKTVGMVAGDDECYELFKELFDPVISARHNGYAPDAKHPTDLGTQPKITDLKIFILDVSKLSDTKIDPTGKYVITSRCRTGRSVKGFKLPPGNFVYIFSPSFLLHWCTAIRPSLFAPQKGQARKFGKSFCTAIRPSSKI